MYSRIAHFYATFRTVQQETTSTRRALTFVARLLRRKAGMLAGQSTQYVMAPRRASTLAAVGDELAHGEPAVAMRVSGGIGDYIVIARFLRDFLAHARSAQFDVYCSHPAKAAWVFAAVPGFRSTQHDILFDRYLPFYDVGLRVSQFALVHHEHVNWEKLRALPWLAAQVDALIRFRPEIETFITHHPSMDNFLALKAVFANRTRRDFLHAGARCGYGGDALPLATDPSAKQACGLAGRRYITVHNGFDTDFIVSGDWATKCYPHFPEVVARLRALLPDLRVVQIGTSTSRSIEGADVSLLGRTTLPQVAAIIGGAAMHLDNEGGLVHLAACLGVRSCVVFGPTPSAYFGYPTNENVDPLVCGGCWWIKKTWMDACPRGFGEARCMTEQPPGAIAARVAAALGAPTGEVPAPFLAAGGG